MRARVQALLFGLALLLATPAEAQQVRRKLGQLAVVADVSEAAPGGVIVVRLQSRRVLATTLAVFGGRRFPFFPSRSGPRAIVPVRVDADVGESTLGIEIRGRRGKQRLAVPVTVQPRTYASREATIPEEKQALLEAPSRVRDGRLLLQVLRTLTPRQRWAGAFLAPVAAEPEPSFGSPQSWNAGGPVESAMDSVWGEYHRGLDFPVPTGTPVVAPAGGDVLLAAPLALTGNTVVIDHGQGVLSVLAHLDTLEVAPGQEVAGGQRLGTSGESGIAPAPHLHWGTYVGTIAVDPHALVRALRAAP